MRVQTSADRRSKIKLRYLNGLRSEGVKGVYIVIEYNYFFFVEVVVRIVIMQWVLYQLQGMEKQ